MLQLICLNNCLPYARATVLRLVNIGASCVS